MKKLSRRNFVRLASMAGGMAALRPSEAVAQMGGGGGGGGMTTTTVIDPPPGARLRDLPVMPNRSTVPGVVEVDLMAKPAQVNVNGVTATLLTYNGQLPAPVIRARSGDILKIHFQNMLPMAGNNLIGHQRDMTNLHTHGLHVSPSGNADNVMLMFMHGDTFDYEYDLRLQDPSTINFYHPHSHGTVAEQYWGGMAGPLIIEDELTALAGYETHILFIKDIAISGGLPTPHSTMMDYMHGKEGDTVLVNGQVNPVLPIRPGQVQRLQIVNACNARFLKLALESHTIYVIGTESGLLDKPYPVSSVLLSPGERVDVLVKANQRAKSYRLLSLPYSRRGNIAGQQVTLLTASYSGTKTNDPLPSTVNPAASRLTNVMPAKTERLALSMGQGRGYINGISFEGMDRTAAVHSTLGTYEIWEIVNDSGMDHPFHQHVNPAQVLSITGGDAAYAALLTQAPAWKDVVLVPKWGSVRMLVPVMDWPGMTMFHCHIIEHEDIGMMGVWHIGEGPMGM